VLLTFDDGTEDAHRLLGPLLARLGVPAALFAAPGLAGQARSDDGHERRFCDGEALRQLAAGGVEVGLHAWEDADLTQLSPALVEADLRRCTAWLERERVRFAPALAYPLGAYPRQDPERRAAFLWAVGRAGVAVAFRIGNRVNRLPLQAPLEVQRTEIKGDDSFLVFAWKVRTGRLRAL
jgi:peptidoglycan/xylan/chitin deacetylase (PgdA/CDA1 family)